MQLHAESHDQGWCSEPDSGNWTWFEFAIMEREVDLLAQNMPLQEEGWGENGDEGQDAEVLEPEEAPAADEAPTNGDVDVAPTNGDVDAAPTNGDVAVDSDAPAVPVTDAAPTNGEVDVVVNNGESVVPVTVEATGGEEVPLTKGEFVDDQAEDDGGLSEDGDWPEYTRDSPPARVKQGIELVFCSHKNWRKDDLKFRPVSSAAQTSACANPHNEHGLGLTTRTECREEVLQERRHFPPRRGISTASPCASVER